MSLAIFCGLVKGFCGKKTSNLIATIKDSLYISTIRMLICCVFGVLFVTITTGSISNIATDFRVILLSLAGAIGLSAFIISWLFCVKRGAYMLTNVFLTLGTIVPILFSALFYGETIKPIQIVGLIVLLVAVWVMCTYNHSLKGKKLGVISILLLLICGLSEGLSSFCQKSFTVLFGVGQMAIVDTPIDISVYNFYTYVFSSIIIGIAFLIFKSKDKQSALVPVKSFVIYVVVMAFALFFNTYFMTSASVELPASLLYPISQGGALVLSTIMCSIFFNEKINIKCIIGIVLTFVALIMINVI